MSSAIEQLVKRYEGGGMIQDVSYCGGSGKLGDLCDPDDRPRVR